MGQSSIDHWVCCPSEKVDGATVTEKKLEHLFEFYPLLVAVDFGVRLLPIQFSATHFYPHLQNGHCLCSRAL